jgi:hypothetical protein
MRMRHFLPAIGLLLPSIVSAQSLNGRSAVLSLQPIGAMLEVYAGEAEIAMSRSATIGFGGTYWGPYITDNDFTYLSGDVKIRYYPDARPFQGFSFGASLGITHVSDNNTTSGTGGSATGPAVGVMIDYNWLLGASQRFYVGTGLGAKALFLSNKTLEESATVRYPTARLSVGWAF